MGKAGLEFIRSAHRQQSHRNFLKIERPKPALTIKGVRKESPRPDAHTKDRKFLPYIHLPQSFKDFLDMLKL